MNNIRSNNYFSLDLELNNKSDKTIPKIIQVGIAIGNPIEPENIKTFKWFIDPQEPIEQFITKLTSITDDVIASYAVDHQTVAEELGALLQTNQCFVNPITWGQGDAAELLYEFEERNINFPFFGRRILDVKTIHVFNQMVNGKTPAGGLRKSMNQYGIKFIGEPHRADVDAHNTLRLFFYFLKRQRVFEDMKEIMSTLR
jgi:inhibitor of KinA sporulation pathway (predicted exonuclease)